MQFNQWTRNIGKVLLNAGALALLQSTCGSVLAAEQPAVQQHKKIRVSVKSESDLLIATFKTENGQIRVVLPADMQPGDSIVGSTILEPRVRREMDHDTALSVLQGYTLGFAGRTQAVKDPKQSWSLPGDLKPDSAILTLTDENLKEVARITVPLQVQGSKDTEAAAAPTAAPHRIILPTKGTMRRPLVFKQAMPRGIEGLQVLVGDREARLLAASPRVYIVESPGDVMGKTTLKVQRSGETLAEGNFNNRRPSSGNPWVYLITGIVVIGVAVAIAAARIDHEVKSLFAGNPTIH